MTITLKYLTTTLTLPGDLFWSDENDWNSVEQTVQRSTTGALIISSAARIAGRPVTLKPDDDSGAWMPQGLLAQLRNFAEVAGAVMQLTVRGTSRDVVFRHHDGPAVEAVPVVHYSDVIDADWYRVTLRFMEV